MRYKLRGDYVFYTKKEPIRNKLNNDGVVTDAIIIDDKVHSVEGQMHKLEIVKEAKVDSALPKQGHSEHESALPKSGNKAGK